LIGFTQKFQTNVRTRTRKRASARRFIAGRRLGGVAGTLSRPTRHDSPVRAKWIEWVSIDSPVCLPQKRRAPVRSAGSLVRGHAENAKKMGSTPHRDSCLN